MNGHVSGTVHIFLMVAAVLLFAGASFPWFTPEPWPWRSRLIAGGLFCWALSEFFS